MNETSEKTKFDTTRPFMSIIPDEVEGEYFDRTHRVYLVNPLDKPLTEVYERIGGFFSNDDGVIEANPKTQGPFEVKPHSALRLEVSSRDEFDELVCSWSITYELDGNHMVRQFSAGKALRETTLIDDCPVLNRRALLVSGS